MAVRIAERTGRKDVLYSPVTLETIDTAVYDWFDKVADIHVETPVVASYKVPVLISSGERAVTAKEKKGIRDQNGVLILPIISIRRTSVERSARMSSLGVQTPNIQISRLVSPKSNNVQNVSQGNNVLPGRTQSLQLPKDAAVYEVTTIPFPDRSILSYEVQIQTQYTTQMNDVLQKVFRELDIQNSFVAPFDYVKKHSLNGIPFEDRPPLPSPYCVGFFQGNVNDSGNFEEFTDQERIIRYTTVLTVPANLNLDPEGEKPALSVERTAYTVVFQPETSSELTPEQIEDLFSPKRGPF